ncbi:MAG: T9SS type A sorting domain-containing protein, partial [Bacteroidota bacterium]
SISTAPGNTVEDAFIYRLSAAGDKLNFSTYLGGTSSDAAYDIALNDNLDVFVCGSTYSNDMPTTAGAFQDTGSPILGNGDGFVARFNASATALTYLTYLGGSDADYAKSLQIDPNDEAIILGAARSANFPTDVSSTAHVGQYDIFLAQLSSDGSLLPESALYGGTYNDYPRAAGALQYSTNGRVTMAITSHSQDMPMVGTTYQTTKVNGINDTPWIASMVVGSVLSVNWLTATAAWEGAYTQLAWTLETDIPVTQLVVERNLGANWEEVVQLPGDQRNWQDRTLNLFEAVWPDQIAYRLIAVDQNGGRSFSQRLALRLEVADWDLYPNPARDQIFLRGLREEGRIEVLNPEGKRIVQLQTLGKGSLRLSVGDWVAGVYLVRFISGSGASSFRRILVQP